MRVCVIMVTMKASCLSTIVIFKCHSMTVSMGSVATAVVNWYDDYIS